MPVGIFDAVEKLLQLKLRGIFKKADWEGHGSSEAFIAFAWQNSGAERLIVSVNYAAQHSQCYVQVPFTDIGDGQWWRLEDLIADATYNRQCDNLQARGL